MAIHTTCSNGMGSAVVTGSTVTTTGMKVEDHMHLTRGFLSNSGIVKTNDCVVTENGTPDRSVNVGVGEVYILNPNYTDNSTSQTKFVNAINDASYNVTLTTNVSGNPRIDGIFAKFDSSATANADNTNTVTFVAVGGTPAGSPVAPSAPVDGNYYELLATVACANGYTTIVTANITSVRKTTGMFAGALSQGQMQNGKFVPSVATNDLTVALKTLSGDNPSVGNPVRIRIGDSIRLITSALSVTKNDATNWFNAGGAELATKEIDYFVYLGYNATDGVVIGFSRIPYGRRYSDFSATTTNEKYCAISTITTASSTDYYENIGRFPATLSAGAGYTWTLGALAASTLIQSPIYQSRWLTWQPVYTASGSMTYSTVSTERASYQLIGNTCIANLSSIGTTGGTASYGIRATLPFSFTSASSMRGGAHVFNGASSISGGTNESSTNGVETFKYDASNWTLAVSQRIAWTKTYEY